MRGILMDLKNSYYVETKETIQITLRQLQMLWIKINIDYMHVIKTLIYNIYIHIIFYFTRKTEATLN